MYQKRALYKAQRAFESASLDDVQRELVSEIAAVVAPRIGMLEVACRGFWLQAVQKWQLQHRKTVDVLSTMTVDQRIANALEMRDHFRREVQRILVDAARLPALDEALDEAFRIYLTRYAHR